MARIRKIEISNFRSVQSLSWIPSEGINCLIGSGDAGKSTILEAIDLCLGARRTIQFTDADFYNLDVGSAISVTLTLGDLDDTLKDIESYGLYLRGYNSATSEVEDEPGSGLETVLTLNLSVGSDLEPAWTLLSERAKAQNASRNLTWGDRVQLAPTRIGAGGHFNLAWRKGSILNRLADEKADAAAALAKAAREARNAFGADAELQLEETLRIVGEAATELGIEVGAKVRALLDAQSVTFSGGTISLHNEDGVPLRGLGVGSARLLIAGLQRRVAVTSAMLLVDEVEHGLEPHRIIRFLGSLGSKEVHAPLQVFMTTHSPVVVRELAGDQLFVVRSSSGTHHVINVGADSDVQSTLRVYPDAFLATSIVVCEGASEVGLLRGIDQYEVTSGAPSIFANGVALIDCAGGEADKPFLRAGAFQKLGYRVAVLRDDDKKPTQEIEEAFLATDGALFRWRDDRALEDELFASLPESVLGRMLDMAIANHDETLVNEHIQSVSNGDRSLISIRSELENGVISDDSRCVLGQAARRKKAGWYKSVTWMEQVGRSVVGPAIGSADSGFREILESCFAWMRSNA